MEALSILISIMVHNIKVFRKRVLSIMTLSIAPLNIKMLRITTLA